ncbi:MAG: acyl-CoA synthetase [Pseudomonadota bacterium]
MHPQVHSKSTPDKAACIIAATGEVLTYRELEEKSNQGAHLFRSLGLKRGDVLAVLLNNEIELFPIAWAAQRAGLYLASISTRFSPADIGYILADSGARLLIASDDLLDLAAQAAANITETVPVYGIRVGERAWASESAAFPGTPIADQAAGADMLYSSGTTGRPKGVKPPLPDERLAVATPLATLGQRLYGMNEDTVYLSTSPLYHSAPQRWALTIQRLGGTVLVMDHFDAEQSLRLIERYRVTHGTWVPTHFVRMLKLPEEVRAAFDLSSLQAAIHAAAPCPVPVKREMIAWLGPIVFEYYSGTEMCGMTALSSEEWLAKPGSVGRAVLGVIKVVDDNGDEVPNGTVGNVYFADGPRFVYHNDPEKTRHAYNRHGWATLGDVGHIDADGYLFLSDRKHFMIISGGVNIYPQEIENCLGSHPMIADVAVIGAPDDEMGERVLAVVQLSPEFTASPELAQDLRAYARAALGGVKCPSLFEFRDALPRDPTGKLMKRKLIDEYRAAANAQGAMAAVQGSAQ